MQTIDSSFSRTSGAAGQASTLQISAGSHGSFQDRADQLVRATVLSDLGQSVGQSGDQGHHSHGIQAVAAAIRKVLSGQDVTGTDAADDVLKKIETSLHKAAQKLADRGVDAKTIDATIDRFRAQLANALDGKSAAGGTASGSGTGSGSASGAGAASGSGPPSGVGGASGSGTPSGAAGASGSGSAVGGTRAPPKRTAPVPPAPTSVSKFVSREVRKERGAIDLVTAEGDRVSIRFRTKEVLTNSAKESTAADGTTTASAKSSVLSSGGVKIDVDGDLNDDELKAIGDLLGKVDDIATQFFSGDVQAAFSAADSLGVDSDQIVGYRLNLTYSRKVSAAYAYAGASLPASTQSPAAGDASSTTSDSQASANDSTSGNSASTSSTGSTGSTGPTASEAGSPATDSTPNNGTSNTPPATTPPASAQKTIMDFLSDALSKLSSANGAGRLSFSTHWKMSVLVTAIESAQPAQPTTAADQATAKNTQLFGDSLQKIASA